VIGRSRRHARAWAAVAVAVALTAACETPGETPVTEEIGTADVVTPAEPAPAPPPVTEEAAVPPEPEIDDDPDRLIGLDPDSLFALLGEPELIRRENPAQIWQYRGVDCVFDVILYREADSSRVTYVEARDEKGRRSEPRACLNQLLRAHSAEASS
jgi:hypothetical protein